MINNDMRKYYGRKKPKSDSAEAMKSMAQGGTYKPLFSEVFTKVNNAKVKSKKVEILKENDTLLRRILKGAFDPKLQWDLPEANSPYMENDTLAQNIQY